MTERRLHLLSATIPISVIPAKAGISGREVSAGLDEIPAFSGMTVFSR
ncbi:MAG TPA: hypothetical protein VGA98_05575 [Allosphingosinicella sp.]|jgi:hypothetical protein